MRGFKWSKTEKESELRKNQNHQKYRNTLKGKKTKSNYMKKYKETTVYQQYQRRYRLNKTYGITPEEFDKMYVEQNGCCYLCNKSEKELSTKLHIDHNHKTGKVRHLLCKKCNSGIGLFNDDPILLQKATDYIKEIV